MKFTQVNVRLSNIYSKQIFVNLFTSKNYCRSRIGLFIENKHQHRGRKPYKPQLMVGLIFYGLMQGISSLRDLERLARVDLGCLLITGGIFPDFSSIGYFIGRHCASLSFKYINVIIILFRLNRYQFEIKVSII